MVVHQFTLDKRIKGLVALCLAMVVDVIYLTLLLLYLFNHDVKSFTLTTLIIAICYFFMGIHLGQTTLDEINKIFYAAMGMKKEIASAVKSPLKPFHEAEKVKAKWSHDVYEIFVDVCLEETLKGNKPGTFFNKEGWKNVEELFYENSGLRYDRKQLKNRWDVMKEQWKVWSKLIGTSSMGWDPNTQTFAASEDDWANYIQGNPDAAQYRFKEPLYADKLSVIFDGTAYSGETQATPPPAQRRKVGNSSTALPLLQSKELVEATPECIYDPFNDAVESRSMFSAQSSLGKLSYSIGECIECLDSMSDEIEQGSDLYLFALDIFLKKEYREVFLQLKKPNVRVAWLQRLQSSGAPTPLQSA